MQSLKRLAHSQELYGVAQTKEFFQLLHYSGGPNLHVAVLLSDTLPLSCLSQLEKSEDYMHT
jgi:hypothetical protein